MSETPRLLIVDDSPQLVESLSSVLQLHDYQVDTAFSGQEALQKIHLQNYGVLICDIEMPGLSGLQLLERLRNLEADLDVILMTGYLEPQYFIKAIQLGAADFISKPIETQHLLKSLQKVLAKRSSRESLERFMRDLDTADVSLVIDPGKFSLAGISSVFNLFFKQNMTLHPDVYNDMLVCLDEMIYNAYIHGTLGLDQEQRKFDNHRLQEIISHKLSLPENASKRIRLSLSVNHMDNYISIEVTDDGNGFDYQSWLAKLAEEPKLNLDGHGRGLAMLYHLSDGLDFSLGGRRVQVNRKLHPTPSPDA